MFEPSHSGAGDRAGLAAGLALPMAIGYLRRASGRAEKFVDLRSIQSAKEI